MPQFINSPYSSNSDGGLASTLTGIGQSMFGDTAKRSLITQQMLEKERHNTNAEPYAAALRDHDARQAMYYGSLGGHTGQDLGAGNLAATAADAGANFRDPRLATMALGAGHPASGTFPGLDVENAGRLDVTKQQGQNQIATEQSKPVTIMGPDGALHLVPSNQTEHLINAGGYKLIPTADQATTMMLGPMQGAPGGPAPVVQPPGGPSAPAQPPAPQPMPNDPSVMPSVPGQPAAAPPPITGDSTAQSFSPGEVSLPKQTKTVPQPQQPGQPDPAGPKQVSYPGQLSPEAREAYLSQLNPAIANTVRMIARGDAAFPNLSSANNRNPYARAVSEALALAYPEVNAYNHAARMVEARSWAGNGVNAVTMRAANTVLPHLEAASNNFASMDNGQYPLLNWLDNASAQFLGREPIQKFNTDKLAVATETARLLHGSGALSEGEIEKWYTRLSAAQSPGQMNSTLAELGDTLAGPRIDAAAHQYRSVISGHEPPIQLMPAAVKARETLRARAGGGAQGPVKVNTPEDAHALPPGTHYVTPDGHEFTR